jgi:hypothetical protein
MIRGAIGAGGGIGSQDASTLPFRIAHRRFIPARAGNAFVDQLREDDCLIQCAESYSSVSRTHAPKTGIFQQQAGDYRRKPDNTVAI